MTVDLEKHAEAILNASGRVNGAYYLNPKLSPYTRKAILAACAALFEAGAEAGIDAAEKVIDRLYDVGQIDEIATGSLIVAIRAIDPASVIEVTL